MRILIFVPGWHLGHPLCDGSVFLFTLVLGLIGGLGRLSKNRVIYCHCYLICRVDSWHSLDGAIHLVVFRLSCNASRALVVRLNLPALSNYQASALPMAVMGLTFCYGAYMSEIYRAGIQSIPDGQMEAAKSLGMNYFKAMRFIILPQAIRMIMPPMGNEFIALLKNSSLVSVVAVADLTRRDVNLCPPISRPSKCGIWWH